MKLSLLETELFVFKYYRRDSWCDIRDLEAVYSRLSDNVVKTVGVYVHI